MKFAAMVTEVPTIVRSISLLGLGWLHNDQSSLTFRQGMGKRVQIPVTAAFIETQDGEHILFDTGMMPPGVEGHELPPEVRAMVASFKPEDDIRRRLEEIGRSVEDVRIIINSHFHWDHAGANPLFPHARVITQSVEFRFALFPDEFIKRPYDGNFLERERPIDLLNGDICFKPGLALMTTPGHTPGHQSLLARLPSGKIMIFSGDAIFCPANLKSETPPGNAHNLHDARQSIARLKMLADFLDAHLVIGHDRDFWQTWQAAPYKYV